MGLGIGLKAICTIHQVQLRPRFQKHMRQTCPSQRYQQCRTHLKLVTTVSSITILDKALVYKDCLIKGAMAPETSTGMRVSL
jgi:hypothetical protein